MKTLRAELAERLDPDVMNSLAGMTRSEIVDTSVHAIHAWLGQPEILLAMTNGMADTGTVGGAVLALRREAVR